MNVELADHIALMAAPIYAAMLAASSAAVGPSPTPEKLEQLRNAAICQAVMLRELAVESSYPD